MIKQQEFQKNSYREACTQFLHQIALDKDSELDRLQLLSKLKEDKAAVKQAQEKILAERLEAEKEREKQNIP